MSPQAGKEIERKFLLREFPRLMKKKDGVRMRQGYLSADTADIEVRIREAVGDTFESRFLTVKRGRGMSRLEEEMSISRESFQSFWPFTSGARVNKIRYSLNMGEFLIEIDEYQDDLAPLVVLEVELHSRTGFSGIELPQWLGIEITGLPEMTNQYLARHGLPEHFEEMRTAARADKTRPITHAGAVPYRLQGDVLEICIVANREGTTRTVPIGPWDKEIDLDDTAKEAALEVVGITGSLDPKAIGIYDETGVRPARVELYALHVTSQRESLTAGQDATADWLSADKAISTVTSPGTARMIEKLRARLSIDDGAVHR